MHESKIKPTIKPFDEVFSKFEISSTVVDVLKSGEVLEINYNKSENILNIFLKYKKLIDETFILSFKKELLEKHPFNNCFVKLSYEFPNENKPKNIISIYWETMLSTIFNISPISKAFLNKMKWLLEGDKLLIDVLPSGSFILKQKNVHVIMHDLILERLNLDLKIQFKDIETTKEHKEKYLKDLAALEAKLVSNAASDLSINEFKTETKKDENNFTKYKGNKRRGKDIIFSDDISGVMSKLDEELELEDDILYEGIIFSFEQREIKSGKILVTFDLTDGTDSITTKFFIQPEKFTTEFQNALKKGSAVKVLGKLQQDDFNNEINVMAKEISKSRYCVTKRQDLAPEKRVELHLHSNMSQMDATNTITDYIKVAKEWGHTAIAITDHGIVQAFPEAMEASKKAGIKMIYGVEAYLVDDLGAIAKLPRDKTINDCIVVFDIETTGLYKESCQIIEIGAVKVVNGCIVDTYNSFVNPMQLLPPKIIELTGITDSMLVDARSISYVLPEFIKFIGDSVLVAHNAAFDMGFISFNAKNLNIPFTNTSLCTVELARFLLPTLTNHKLATLIKHFNIKIENHHRASDDATATAEIFLKFAEVLKEKHLISLNDINIAASKTMDKKKLKYYHAIILVKEFVGLRNLYELISLAHIDYYNKRPRIPKSEYLRLKEGLIIGTACEAGEFYKAIRDDLPQETIDQLADFYDYFEIQPLANNAYLVRNNLVRGREGLININKKIVEYGEIYNKPVVATCDVHFLNPEDEIFRKILLAGSGFKDADEATPLYFRTTTEMLSEFSYLGEEKAFEVVVTNTNKIAQMCDTIKPIPDETFAPEIEGSEDELRDITMKEVKRIYGEQLHELIQDRLDRELQSIIKNGFAVMYIIAQKLVWNSVENGYLVGSRGSVGSSFVACMAGITEVNSLPPHYVCPSCKYTDFDSEIPKSFAGASGCDMPDALCPVCNTQLLKDGHDIPFETFLGFDGDKEPDIDLNFSGEYQAKAHAYTEELFGTGFVFKAGTIGTLADKTAYGYVMKYIDERKMTKRNAEINRLSIGCTGVKKTTGQHPGGLMIVPSNQSIYNFTPVQRPANDMKSTVTTTHFDYHSISGRLLKLDILGHDVPTIIRSLHDMTGIDPRVVDLGDKDVMSLFTSPHALGVSETDINCKTGSLGLPEFGTSFVRSMLMDTQPTTFAELVRISGLSHGTDVWFNNAAELIKDGIATLKNVIPTRDDIMVYLILQGCEKKTAFKIMENVRKGKGLTDDEVKTMQAINVPEWYIESCRRIKYMFPKGHAVAYVMMSVRIGYFKIHYPLAFYASIFSVKADSFNYETMCKGRESVVNEMKRIIALGREAPTKEKDVLTTLELVLEMYARGLQFAPLDVNTSDAAKFLISGNAILPPLCALQGLGANAAVNVVQARDGGEFISYEDFRERTHISKTVIEVMKAHRILGDVPETNQYSLF